MPESSQRRPRQSLYALAYTRELNAQELTLFQKDESIDEPGSKGKPIQRVALSQESPRVVST